MASGDGRRPIVIVGAGIGGVSAAETLRREGYSGRVVLLGAEREQPYDRPPLSKGFLTGTTPEEKVLLRPAAFYDEQQIELRLGSRVVGVDIGGRHVSLASGETLAFDSLLVATGATPRQLEVPGATLRGVYTLRTLADARALALEIARAGQRAGRVVVIGGGFIGAEVAAHCRERGLEVTMIEMLPMPLARALGEEVGALYAA
ncbi:MAG: FAD-dependent oxidoreductase, partial [Ktedonobacterales bacterium]|nr:FAD-dependent oxidoreductase [Ktedonobacterales bacterium]